MLKEKWYCINNKMSCWQKAYQTRWYHGNIASNPIELWCHGTKSYCIMLRWYQMPSYYGIMVPHLILLWYHGIKSYCIMVPWYQMPLYYGTKIPKSYFLGVPWYQVPLYYGAMLPMLLSHGTKCYCINWRLNWALLLPESYLALAISVRMSCILLVHSLLRESAPSLAPSSWHSNCWRQRSLSSTCCCSCCSAASMLQHCDTAAWRCSSWS